MADVDATPQAETAAVVPPGPLRHYLDQLGRGSGEPAVEPIGEGHSNLTFLVRRGEERLVLRRPPLGKLSQGANDVLREGRVLAALADSGVPVPAVVALCEDEEVIGAPFFLAAFVPGHVLVAALPAGWPTTIGERIAARLVGTLAALHRVDLGATGLDAFGRPDGYLERQLRRFSTLLEENATRPLPQLERVHAWLEENLPSSPAPAFVHGDYRLGNVILDDRGEIRAVLDWEMATTGDPLADLGYLCAMWAEPDDPETPMAALSKVTRGPEALALWKAAIFLEGSYRRHREGKSDDPYFARLDAGVPAMADAALARIRTAR
ncbi:MAG: phosphotransferase family protein [Actinobacteria bacterium]|nr:phosphotransferase family protein [Actinomycetota bacterium]